MMFFGNETSTRKTLKRTQILTCVCVFIFRSKSSPSIVVQEFKWNKYACASKTGNANANDNRNDDANADVAAAVAVFDAHDELKRCKQTRYFKFMACISIRF